MTTQEVLALVAEERTHQEALKRAGRFKHTCADLSVLDETKLAILAEEVGEAARCVLEVGGHSSDVHGKNLLKEVIQVAAVAVAWAESLA